MITKKRYVGYAYESAAQLQPVFDAKGIETVRRDQCRAVAIATEGVLHRLFRTLNLDTVRDYVCDHVRRIAEHSVSLADLVFAKEVHLGSYSATRPPPPAALVALKEAARDARLLPAYNERVRYVVIEGVCACVCGCVWIAIESYCVHCFRSYLLRSVCAIIFLAYLPCMCVRAPLRRFPWCGACRFGRATDEFADQHQYEVCFHHCRCTF